MTPNMNGIEKTGTIDLYDVFAVLIRQWELPDDQVAKVAKDIILKAQKMGKD